VSLAPQNSSIGVVGLGNLGQAIALNLISQNWQVFAVDTSEKRVQPVVEAGGTAADIGHLALCDVVCFVVPDERAIWEVLTGSQRLLDRLSSQQTIIVHSTLLPSEVKNLAEHAEQKQGVQLLDAPVTGGAARARAGDLTVLVGGTENTVNEMRPLLECEGSNVHHLGPVGAGAAAKLANQLVMFAALSGLHEALQLAESYGVSQTSFLDAISSGTADTWVGRNWGFFDRTARDYNDAGVAIQDRPWSKDLHEVLGASLQSGLALPFAELMSRTVSNVIETHAREHDQKEVQDEHA
jgi:3-hydroxyisobutyrate dehydrogenase